MKNKIGIGIVSPSYSISIVDEKWIAIGIEKLESLGFLVKFGTNVKEKEEYSNIGGSVKNRIDDINQFLLDDSIDIIMAAIGGYGSNQLLQSLDYDLIKKANKKFIGFSDTTILLNAIYQKTGIPTYLGPAFVTFGNPNIPTETIENFMNVVIGEQKNISYKEPQNFYYDDWYLNDIDTPRDMVKHKGYKFIQDGKAEGIVVGGNCQSLLRLAGTEYFPETKDRILLIEDVQNENPDVFICELTQLKNMGIFKNICGLFIGQFGYDNKFYESDNFESKIKEICDNKDIPILINTTFSHVDPIYSLKIGGEVLLDSKSKTLILK